MGWFATLCGFLSLSLIEIQQTYLSEIASKKSASRWATNLTKHLWDITHQLWTQRNDALHNSEQIEMLSGKATLRSSIVLEYNLGADDLPSVYSKYFHLPLRFLFKKKIGFLKRWFRLIRSAREGLSDNCPYDEFSENGSLRTWVGLIKKP